MSFFPADATSGTKERTKIPAGTHEAYCFGVVDLGTQERKPYMGKPKDPARAVALFFEFPEVLHKFKDDEPEAPMIKSQQFTFFTDEKSSLYKFLMPWLGKKVQDVDFDALPGEPASITITHQVSEKDGKEYDNITAIGPVSPKLIKMMPARHNKTMLFSIQLHGFGSPEFDSLYPWLKEKLKKSPEYQQWEQAQSGHSEPAPESEESSVPF